VKEVKEQILEIIKSAKIVPVPPQCVVMMDYLEGLDSFCFKVEQLLDMYTSCGLGSEAPANLIDTLVDCGRIIMLPKAADEESAFVIVKPDRLFELLSDVMFARRKAPPDAPEEVQRGYTTGLFSEDFINVVMPGCDAALVGPLLRFLQSMGLLLLAGKRPYRVLVPNLFPPMPCTFVKTWSMLDGFVDTIRIYFLKNPPNRLFRLLTAHSLQIEGVMVVNMFSKAFVLHHASQTGLCIWDKPSGKLTLWMRGPKKRPVGRRRLLLTLLVEKLELLLKWYFPNLQTLRRAIACPHCVKSKSADPFMFDLQDVMAALSKGNPFVYCNNIVSVTRCVQVATLAPDFAFMDIRRIDNSQLEVGEVIGHGAFGTVNRGKYGGADVAMKTPLLKPTMDDANLLDMYREIQHEAYIMSFLSHPNLLRLHGVALSPLRLVMDYAPHGDLYHFLHKEPAAEVSMRMKMRIAFDIACGMRYLQSMHPPILHRDLRSPNIFLASLDVDSEVVAKVADFGLSIQGTQAAGALGSWQWMAPETITASRDSEYDCTADTYSFGMVCYELINQQVPFAEFEADPNFTVERSIGGEHKTVLDVIKLKRAICSEALRPTLADNCPPVLREIIQLCWVHQPSERPSFALILDQLCLNNHLSERQRGKLGMLRSSPSTLRSSTLWVSQEHSSSSSLGPSELSEQASEGPAEGPNHDVGENVIELHNRIWIANELVLMDPSTLGMDLAVTALRVAGKVVWLGLQSGHYILYDSVAMDMINMVPPPTNSPVVKFCSVVPRPELAMSSVFLAVHANGVVASLPVSHFNFELLDRTPTILTTSQLVESVATAEVLEDDLWLASARGVLHIIHVSDGALPASRRQATYIAILSLQDGGRIKTSATPLQGTQCFLTVTSCEHPSGMWLACDGTICVFSAETRALVGCFVATESCVTCLCPVGRNIWAGDSSGNISVWDGIDAHLVQVAKSHTANVTAIAECVTGFMNTSHIVTTCDEALMLWSGDAVPLNEVTNDTQSMWTGVDVAANGFLWLASADGALCVFLLPALALHNAAPVSMRSTVWQDNSDNDPSLFWMPLEEHVPDAEEEDEDEEARVSSEGRRHQEGSDSIKEEEQCSNTYADDG